MLTNYNREEELLCSKNEKERSIIIEDDTIEPGRKERPDGDPVSESETDPEEEVKNG